MIKYRLVFLILFCLQFLLPPQLMSQESVTKKMTLGYRLHYYECIKPPDVKCMVCTEKEKKLYPKCVEWKMSFVTGSVSPSFDVSAYAYDAGVKLPRANFFLRDVASTVYGVNYPSTKYNYPVTIYDFYLNHESYGWEEISPASSKVGSIALWPNIGGLVVEEFEPASPDSPGVVVIYPSDVKEGMLRASKARFIGDANSVKFLVPKKFIEKQVKE